MIMDGGGRGRDKRHGLRGRKCPSTSECIFFLFEIKTRRWQQLLKKGLLNTRDTTGDVETTLRGGDRMTDATREQDEVERDRRGSAGVGDSS